MGAQHTCSPGVSTEQLSRPGMGLLKCSWGGHKGGTRRPTPRDASVRDTGGQDPDPGGSREYQASDPAPYIDWQYSGQSFCFFFFWYKNSFKRMNIFRYTAKLRGRCRHFPCASPHPHAQTPVLSVAHPTVGMLTLVMFGELTHHCPELTLGLLSCCTLCVFQHLYNDMYLSWSEMVFPGTFHVWCFHCPKNPVLPLHLHFCFS